MAGKIAAINPTFKAAIIANSVICVCCFIGMLVVAYYPPKTPVDVYGPLKDVFILTAGAFVGLLGGRAGVPDQK